MSKQGIIDISSMDLNKTLSKWQLELQRVFANIPLLDGLGPKDFTITRLPGYTNRNYRLHQQRL